MCSCRWLKSVSLFSLLLLAGCFEDRTRPYPVEPAGAVRLSVQLLSPRSGLTIGTGDTVKVSVSARDLAGQGLSGLGFVARRFSSGLPKIDSAAIHFPARSDSIHDFTFRMPDLPTNTQIDVYGIAFGLGARRELSAPSPLVVVRCVNGTCR